MGQTVDQGNELETGNVMDGISDDVMILGWGISLVPSHPFI